MVIRNTVFISMYEKDTKVLKLIIESGYSLLVFASNIVMSYLIIQWEL